MATFGVDSSTPRKATKGGVAFFPRLLYDSGNLTNFPDQSITALDLGRFGITHYLNYQNGVQPWPMGQCQPLADLGMYNTAVGNAFGSNTVDAMSSGNGGFAAVTNPQVSGVPFRTAFSAHAGGGLVYLADEPNVSISANILQWRTTYHTEMASLPILHVLLPEGPLTCGSAGAESQFGSAGFTEHLLSVANPYWWMRQSPAGGNDWIGEDPYPIFRPETTPGASGGVLEQGGYPHFWVADRAAHTVAAAIQNQKVPILILQLFTGLFGARFPTAPELWAHMTMAVAEGIRGVGWWQLGTNGGLRDQGGATFTNAENALIAITQFLATNEATILSTPITTGWTNSTQTGTSLAWRLGICPTVAAACQQTSFGDGGRVTYIAERNALQAGVTTWSPMLDQNGHVRMRVFQKDATTRLVFAYNYAPSVSGTVTFTAPTPVTSVTVVGEGRTITPSGTTWTDTFGGSSSLNQATPMAHIYQVTVSTTSSTMPALAGSYSLTGGVTTLSQAGGPLLIGFIHSI